MGILRYVVQGFGWEIGRQAAKEGMEALADEAAPPSRIELKERKKEEARKQKQIEVELRRLKKQNQR